MPACLPLPSTCDGALDTLSPRRLGQGGWDVMLTMAGWGVEILLLLPYSCFVVGLGSYETSGYLPVAVGFYFYFHFCFP